MVYVSSETVGTHSRHRDLARRRATEEARGGDPDRKFLKTWKAAEHKIGTTPFWTFRVASRSGGGWHTVLVAINPVIAVCSCTAYYHRETCTHSAAVELRIEREGVPE